MTNFNPKSHQYTADQWQIIASETIAESNTQYLVIGGIVGGFIAASATAFPPTGFLVALWALYEAWRKTGAVNRNEQAIAKYGCVAHVLTGDNFRDYRAQVGDSEVLRQIAWTADNGYALSNDALDFLETQPPFILPAAQSSTPQLANTFHINPHQEGARVADTQVVTFVKETPDLPAVLAATLKNSLIVGVPGAGKGIFVSNALEHLKRKGKHKVTVFYIDPKGDPNESEYFTGRVDKLYRADIIHQSAAEIYQWLQNALDDFDRTEVEGIKLLVLDELTAIAGILETVKGAIPWLKSRLTSYSSSGSSRGIVMWGMAQSAHVEGLGIDGGTRSIFIPVFLISADQITASVDILRCGMIPTEKKLNADHIQLLCRKSPVGRAIFFGISHEWYPAPQMQNYSGFDRDTRTFLSGYAPPKNDSITTNFNAITRLEKSFKGEPEETHHVNDSSQSGMTEHEQQLLSWMKTRKATGREYDLNTANKNLDKLTKPDDFDSKAEYLRHLARQLKYKNKGKLINPNMFEPN